MIMPELNATKRNDEIATMSDRANCDNTTSKLPAHKWNRSNSINVTYIPLLERRHNNGLSTNEDTIIDYVTELCQNDACSLTSVNGNSLCCCSRRTKSSSSCWHLKRKQIIRQSSHASEIARYSTKKSISLPATPNLSQLRRPVRSSYKKLNEQQGKTTVEAVIHMPLTYEQFPKKQHFHQQTPKTPTNSISKSQATNNTPPATLTPTLTATSASTLPATRKFNTSTKPMLLKHCSLRYEDTTRTSSNKLDNNSNTDSISTSSTNNEQYPHNNNNNNNATICKTICNNNNINKMSKTPGCFLQTCSYQNENGENNMANIKHHITNTPCGDAGNGGGFLRCEHCCESISRQSNGHQRPRNNGQDAKHLKSTSFSSDPYHRSDSETVSELSSYRFVTDEDIGIVNNNNCSSSLSLNENANQIKRLTECVSNVEKNYDDNDFKENTNHTTTAIKYETRNVKNKNEFTQTQHQPQLLNRDRYHANAEHNKQSREQSVQKPTKCCYTIDKSNSEQFIPYDNSNNNNDNDNNNHNNILTKPVKIPVRNDKVDVNLRPSDCALSSSLPRNYGSDFETCTFARQVYIRNSLRYQKTAPPVPPKPLINTTEDPCSYDPQKFYRKLQRFENQTSCIQTTLPREIPTGRVQERSITPEKCELLNCFPSYRNRNLEETSNLNGEITQPTNGNAEIVNHSIQTSENSVNGQLNNTSNHNTILRNQTISNDFNTPKRTLRYDNHGRLKCSFLTQLPVTNYRRASLDNDLPRKCHSPSFNLKLTPTLTRKFQYSPKHNITKEINEETEEEIEEIHPHAHASEQNDQNVTSVNNNTSPPNTSILNSPTSPASFTTRSLLQQKKSYSTPLVIHHDRLASPVWLSSETIESHTSSSQKCLDEVQSNCSDQTTIFHFEHDNSLSTSPSFLLYGSGGVSVAGQHSNYGHNGNSNIFKGPLLVKRLPAIQSFGYIPTQSSSLGSANVREEFEKGISMEKRRNTLDRFQRLAFGRKSSNNTNASSSTAAGSSTRNRKSSEKTEKLRELTELLRVGNRSSPTPPPVPPPRKPRAAIMQSSTQSSETPDGNDNLPDAPTPSLILQPSSSPSLAAGAEVSETSVANEPLVSFMSTHNDDILPIDQDEHANNSTLKSPINLPTPEEAVEHSDTAHFKVNNIEEDGKYITTTANTTNTSTTPKTSTASSPTILANASLSNLELLIQKKLRAKSTSPPLLSGGKRECTAATAATCADVVDGEMELIDSLSSTHIATKLDKPESRTIICSDCQKGVPFRSASFSAIDYAAGKYKKTALSALRDRLKREKSIDSSSPPTSLYNSIVDNLTWPRKKLEETPLATNEKTEATKTLSKSKPDWIYIPLKEKPELSINLCYGQDKALEDVMESPDLLPEEEVFMADTIQEVPDKVKAACVTTMVAAHATMESLTDTIQSDNDYIIDESQLPITVESKDLQDAKTESLPNTQVMEVVPSINPLTDIFEPNLATLMEEQLPLESPPDNFLQTATTCLIPVPVFECAAQEWGMENPPQEWVEAKPEKFDVVPESIQPLVSLDITQIENVETKIRNELVPTISVSRSSDELDEIAILRKPPKTEEAHDKNNGNISRQTSVDDTEAKKGYTNEDDVDIIGEKRSSLENIPTRHSADERRKADMSKRRKGIYIENWHDHGEGEITTPVPKTLALDITIANLNAIKPDSPDDSIMYINSPLTDENRTPASIYSFDLNTPEAECQNSPIWTTKNSIMASFSLQSSEEKDDMPLASPPVCLSTSHITLPRNHKSYPYLRTDSISDNESDRTPPPSRDRTSPALSDYDFKRYSKRPLRGPYGQMLEAEMKKPNKMHFEEILEDLRESEGSIQPRRQRSTQDDAGGRSNLPHYSNSMRVRKTTNSTYLPVPQHTRAASTPSQIENVRSCGSRRNGNADAENYDDDYDDDSLIKVKPLEKKCQSTLDTTTIGRDELLTTTTTPVAVATTVAATTSLATPTCKQAKSSKVSTILQREQKRASSEAPVTKTHSKRSQSMSCTEKPTMAHLQHVHQQKRSLDVTSSNKANKSNHSNINNNTATGHKSAGQTSQATPSSASTTNILPTPELLAQLLKGSSEKLLSEQRQQMYAKQRREIGSPVRRPCTEPVDFNLCTILLIVLLIRRF